MLRATLIPIITPSYTANPWSTIFMNEPNLDVTCGGGVNSLWAVSYTHLTLPTKA